MSQAASPLICALDLTDIDHVATLASQLAPSVGAVKLGQEFFTTNGPDGVRAVAADVPIFLDLKFHDIPNTVAAAVRSVAPLRPAMLTVHACGGMAMMRAACDAARQSATVLDIQPPLILAVTVLTSLSTADLEGLGMRENPADWVMRLADVAGQAGCDGVVCSPHELTRLRDCCGNDFVLVTPGIRPLGDDHNDQKRTATPSQAIAAGADYIVVGRPITRAADPVAAAARIAATLAQHPVS